MRGFMLDSARTLERRDYYPRFIDFIADRGCDTLLWHFTDDQGCSLRFDRLPQAASPNAYRREELADLLKHARDRRVQVIPELETLGHTRYLTGAGADLAELAENNDEFTSLCPVHPRVRPLLADLLEEVCDRFDSELVHVGLDEVNFADHPLTRAALRDRTASELFADHVRFLHACLARRGRRLMMWGDHLLKDPALAAAIPRDILVANWQYAPVVPGDTTDRLQQWGFEVVSCPALISHDQPLFPGEAFALPNLRATADHVQAHRTRGTITTIWTPQRYLPGALWPAIDLAAGIMRDGSAVPVDQSMARFAESFFGFTAGAAWREAMAAMWTHSPMRKPWIAALKLDRSAGSPAGDPAAEARVWSSVRAALQQARSSVRREQAGYASLLLMVEVLEHVWERSAAVAAGRVSGALLDRSVALGERLSRAWDTDRFADDPRKTRPVFPFDRDNHLLIAFEAGTAAAIAAAHPR